MASVTIRQRTKKKADGTIAKLGWSYRFEKASIDGKRQRFEKGGFKKKADAQMAGNAAYAEYMRTGLCFTPTEISVSDYMDMWIKDYCEVNLKSTTVDNYKKKIKNYIKPALGQYRLNCITSINIQKFLNEKFNEGFSRNSLASMKGILTGSLNYAVNTLQFIKTNPAITTKLPLTRAEPEHETRKHDRVVVPSEVMQDIFKRFPQGHPCHIPLQLGYRCGLRLGEAFGVSWNDIDFKKQTLTVNWQVQMNEKKKLWRLVLPKYNSIRVIKLDSIMMNILRQAKEEQSKNESIYADFYTIYYLDDKNHIVKSNFNNSTRFLPVNVREDGSYIAPRVMCHAFRVISGKDNPKAKNHVHTPLNYTFDFHSLRHTHATMLLSAGVSPVVVKERLGHKNIETTLGIYAHVTETMNDLLLDALNDII
jgi:integrase